MTTIYTRLAQANDKFAALQSVGSEAAAQFAKAEQGHGTGAILEVALIASAIRLNLLTYTAKSSSGVKSVTFNTDLAIAAARLTFNRYAEEHGKVPEGTHPFGHDGSELGNWRTRVLSMLHPYTINGQLQAWDAKAKTLEAVETANINSRIPVAGLPKAAATKAVLARAEAVSRLKDEIDRVEKARAAAKGMFDIACLYVALDDNGSLLQASETDSTKAGDKRFGLKFRLGHFIPYNKVSVDPKLDTTVLLQPVDKRSGSLYYFERTEAGTQGAMKAARVSLASFTQAWRMPVEKPTAATPWHSGFDYIEKNLRTTTELSAADVLLFEQAYNRMLAFKQALDKARGRDKGQSEPKPEETPASIANREMVPQVKSA